MSKTLSSIDTLRRIHKLFKWDNIWKHIENKASQDDDLGEEDSFKNKIILVTQ